MTFPAAALDKWLTDEPEPVPEPDENPRDEWDGDIDDALDHLNHLRDYAAEVKP